MEITYQDINSNIRRIMLSGRMDIQGTDSISDQFSALSADAKRNIVVDFTGVTFLASIGIRALISNAKAQHKLGGRMALVVGSNTSVARTLDATGIEVLLKIYNNQEEAEKALSGMAA